MEYCRKCNGIITFVLVCAFLVFYLPVEADWTDEIQNITSINRSQTDLNIDMEAIKKKFSTLIYHFQSFDNELIISPKTLKTVLPKSRISKHEALEDVEYLFSLLKYGYAGYQYFGGDDRFLATKTLILERLNAISYDEFTTFWFLDLLYQHLSFINDGHFFIGNRSFRQVQSMSMDLEYNFLRDDIGYYTEHSGTKEYLELVNGEQPDPYLWPALNDAGAIVYRIGKLGLENNKAEGFELMEIILNSNNFQRRDYAILEQMGVSDSRSESYERFSISGIPVIATRVFDDSLEMEQFVEDAYELKNEDLFVIDLRSNKGGFGGHLGQWLDILTDGGLSAPPFFRIDLRTNTVITLAMNSIPSILDGISIEAVEAEFRSSESGWSEISSNLAGRNNPSTAKIVVLIDSDTASAGESFVELLRQLENVVFIGTNTAGSYLIGNPVHSSLPNSSLSLYFGTTLMMTVDSGRLVDREGIGFYPDFWVQPDDALELAIKFIENYN